MDKLANQLKVSGSDEIHRQATTSVYGLHATNLIMQGQRNAELETWPRNMEINTD